jgi:hypothetical protein
MCNILQILYQICQDVIAADTIVRLVYGGLCTAHKKGRDKSGGTSKTVGLILVTEGEV